MQWLAPMMGLYAAAAAVPLLVVLYFLKLKRREQMVSSTLLWKRAVQDLQVNAPFQKLRWNILLLLQLLALLAILVALARPVLLLTVGPARRYVMLIDRSASMSATDGAPAGDASAGAASGGTTRLEAAKKRARVLVESLRGGFGLSLRDTTDQAMVIAFDDHAQVMCNFTSDKRQLLAAIDSIEPTDGGSSLSEAVTVGQAFAQSPDDETNNRTAETRARLELFSDGRIADLDDLDLQIPEGGGGKVNFHRVGRSGENIAIVNMQARRSFRTPERVDVFATVANFGLQPATLDVQLSLDGDIRAVRSVTIPGRSAPHGDATPAPGKVSLTFGLTHPGAGVVEVRQLRRDLLHCDDAAWAVLDPPRKLAVLLVTNGNVALRSALAACPLASMDVRTLAQYDAMDHDAMNADPPYDVIVLDRHPAAKLPRCRYLILGRPPEGLGVTASEQLKNQVVIDWRERHPVLQSVNMSNLFAAKCWKLSLPRGAEVLAEFADTPALVLTRRGGGGAASDGSAGANPGLVLLGGFDVMETNWPFEPGFVMFCYNAMSFLGLEADAGSGASGLRVGEPIVMEALPPGAPVRLKVPSGEPGESSVDEKKLTCDDGGTFRYPGANRAGVYTVTVADRSPFLVKSFAVNLLDPVESDIGPADEIVLSGTRVEAQEAAARLSNVELWPWLAALVLVLVCLEWFVYNTKVRL